MKEFQAQHIAQPSHPPRLQSRASRKRVDSKETQRRMGTAGSRGLTFFKTVQRVSVKKGVQSTVQTESELIREGAELQEALKLKKVRLPLKDPIPHIITRPSLPTEGMHACLFYPPSQNSLLFFFFACR
jgi:hypothetical protein